MKPLNKASSIVILYHVINGFTLSAVTPRITSSFICVILNRHGLFIQFIRHLFATWLLTRFWMMTIVTGWMTTGWMKAEWKMTGWMMTGCMDDGSSLCKDCFVYYLPTSSGRIPNLIKSTVLAMALLIKSLFAYSFTDP